MKLVDDANQAWRWISMRIAIIGAALPPIWLGLPDDWKAAVPKWAILVFTIIYLAVMAGRVIDQTPKPKVPDSPT